MMPLSLVKNAMSEELMISKSLKSNPQLNISFLDDVIRTIKNYLELNVNLVMESPGNTGETMMINSSLPTLVLL